MCWLRLCGVYAEEAGKLPGNCWETHKRRRAVMFAKIKEGERAGEFAQYDFSKESPQVRVDSKYPRNPYATGYGCAIPTRYRVKTVGGRWRRVYCVCYSNCGTCYVWQNGERVIVDIV
jgi:hypothetical protein